MPAFATKIFLQLHAEVANPYANDVVLARIEIPTAAEHARTNLLLTDGDRTLREAASRDVEEDVTQLRGFLELAA